MGISQKSIEKAVINLVMMLFFLTLVIMTNTLDAGTVNNSRLKHLNKRHISRYHPQRSYNLYNRTIPNERIVPQVAYDCHPRIPNNR